MEQARADVDAAARLSGAARCLARGVRLFCFASLELVYAEPANPRAHALAIALYSYAMWFGMAAYGRRTWDEHGNGFSVYFGLFARIAPFGERDGRLVVRMPLSGLRAPIRLQG